MLAWGDHLHVHAPSASRTGATDQFSLDDTAARAPVGVFRATVEGEIQAANERLSQLLAFPDPRSMEGVALSSLVANRAAFAEFARELERFGEARADALSFETGSGTLVVADLSARIAPPTDGEPGIVGVVDRVQPSSARNRPGYPSTDAMDGDDLATSIVSAADAAGLGLAINLIEGDGPRLVFLNDCGARLLGRKPRGLVGGPATPWSLGELGQRLNRSLTRRRDASGDAATLRGEIEQPDGSTVVIEAGLAPGRYQGKPATFVFFRDVTDDQRRREQLADAEERHRSIVEAADRADVAVAILTETADRPRIASVNATTAEILDVPREDVIGQPASAFVRDEDVEVLEASPDGPGRPERVEVLACQPDGTQVPLEVGLARGQFEGRPAIFAFGRDVSEDREAERELEELNRRLEASNEDLQRFAYAVSHDLREPLRMVSSYVDLIEDRFADDLPGEGLEMLDFVREGTQRMDRMIEALLDYSRVDTRGGEPEPTESLRALNAALSSLKVRLHEEGVEVTHDELPTVRADPDQLMRLFQNLIANALDHGGPDLTTIDVGAERLDGAWRITVEDDGAGVDPGDADRVFEVFHRGADAAVTDGVGLGLAMCERIVERHGGEIGIDPDASEGACFWFTLPGADVGDGRERVSA